ncbi:hypothetical protein REPUB_Repub05bG0084800 [Reevesia pubescens]
MANESIDDEEESFSSNIKSADHAEESSNSRLESTDDHESKKILLEMETIVREVKESEFYTELQKQIKGEEFQRQLTRVLNSHSDNHAPMVIYALGSLKNTNSKYQLAVALLLQQDLSDWISNRIEVYDPVLSPVDIIVLETLGCTVLSVNEECKRQVERPTLFFMPYANQYYKGNLLESNWLPSNINNVILLTNKMSEGVEDYQDKIEYGEYFGDSMIDFMERMEYLEAIQKCIQDIEINGYFEDIFLDDVKEVTDNFFLHKQLYELPFMEQMQYLEAIQNYTEELDIPNLGELFDNFIYNFSFHFFNVAPEIDMETLIQGKEEIQMKFQRQFDKLWKLEQQQMVAIIEALIIKAWNDQMSDTENITL